MYCILLISNSNKSQKVYDEIYSIVKQDITSAVLCWVKKVSRNLHAYLETKLTSLSVDFTFVKLEIIDVGALTTIFSHFEILVSEHCVRVCKCRLVKKVEFIDATATFPRTRKNWEFFLNRLLVQELLFTPKI